MSLQHHQLPISASPEQVSEHVHAIYPWIAQNIPDKMQVKLGSFLHRFENALDKITNPQSDDSVLSDPSNVSDGVGEFDSDYEDGNNDNDAKSDHENDKSIVEINPDEASNNNGNDTESKSSKTPSKDGSGFKDGVVDGAPKDGDEELVPSDDTPDDDSSDEDSSDEESEATPPAPTHNHQGV